MEYPQIFVDHRGLAEGSPQGLAQGLPQGGGEGFPKGRQSRPGEIIGVSWSVL